MTNRRLYIPCEDSFKRATDMLKQGDIVSFPTETVYGLGADATNSRAVAKIYDAKNRPSFNPLIVHLADAKKVARYVQMNDLADKLARAFWPGPFTMVLPIKPECGLSDLITAGLGTVAVRVPKNSVAHELLSHFDGPIAAPSANKSGNVSPTTADHVNSEFGDELKMIIDGGKCEKGIESTIVHIENNLVTLLRPGNITAGEIEKIIGKKILINETAADAPIAPGQLKSHYSPHTKMRLNVKTPQNDEAYLAFGTAEERTTTLNLSPAGDLIKAAANLFSMMRALDQMNLSTIAVAPIPQTGLGVAINDRLARAAAPKGE